MNKTNPRFSHDNITNRRKYTGVHWHDDYELYYMVNGTTKYFIGDEIFQIANGDFVIIPPSMYHMTDSKGCLYNERYLLGFELGRIDKRAYSALNKLCEKKVVRVQKSKLGILEDIFLKLEEEYSGEKNPVLIDLYMTELVIKLERLCAEYKPCLSEADMLIHEISRYISINYSSDLSLDNLSKKFAMSASHLSRRFKAVAGIGITEYITYVRILNAEKLLKMSGLPVTEVAAACGFNDSNYFSTVFKRIKGTTPLKFSKKFI